MPKATYKEWLKQAEEKCRQKDKQDKDLSKDFAGNRFAAPLILLEHVTKKSKASLRAHDECELTNNELCSLNAFLERYLANEPIAYIMGMKEFYGRDFIVSSSTLIPRPETELIIDLALEIFKGSSEAIEVCDIGTGTGCIAISLLCELENAKGLAYDISSEAIEVAKKNAIVHKVEQKLEFVLEDIALAQSERLFDCIISNPPYIPQEEYDLLDKNVKEYEPQIALTSGNSGLEVIENVLLFSSKYLKSEGVLLIEHGYNQEKQVQEIARKYSCYQDIESIKDHAGQWRVFKAIKK